MTFLRHHLKAVSRLLLLSFAMLSLQIPVARAEIIGTDAALSAQQAVADRARLDQLLGRADVSERLVALGVEPAEVKARVAALSDEEVVALNQKIDQLPAGGDALGVLVFLFVLLLVTDILGFTDVFPFVKKGR